MTDIALSEAIAMLHRLIIHSHTYLDPKDFDDVIATCEAGEWDRSLWQLVHDRADGGYPIPQWDHLDAIRLWTYFTVDSDFPAVRITDKEVSGRVVCNPPPHWYDRNEAMNDKLLFDPQPGDWRDIRNADGNLNRLQYATNSHGMVALRYRDEPDSVILRYTASEWTAFQAGAHLGEFDFSTLADACAATG